MMRLTFLLLFYCSVFLLVSLPSTAKYEPTWPSIDSRPLPAWYDEAKLGIFIHWGVFSVPSYGGHQYLAEWFWKNWQETKVPAIEEFMKRNYPPGFTYADFASQFHAELYDPDLWAEIVQASGAKYVVLTSKHGEGFTNWPSKYSWNWNSMDVGPKRDLVGSLETAIRNKTDVRFGLYYNHREWFNPLLLKDRQNNYTTQEYVKNKLMPELMDIVNTYKPEILWVDGDSDARFTYWNSTHFLAWLYNESPVKDFVAVNDRWGKYCRNRHGGYYTGTDRYNPGILQKHKFENAMTIDSKSWGYRREAQLADYLDMDKLIQILAETISCGGNLLVNIGPTHDGRIVPIFEERLRQLGSWLKVNGEAIYASKPWRVQNDTSERTIWYTSKPSGSTLPYVYAIILDWPVNNHVILWAPVSSNQTSVFMLGHQGALQWKAKAQGKGIIVTMPTVNPAKVMSWAWVLKLVNVK